MLWLLVAAAVLVVAAVLHFFLLPDGAEKGPSGDPPIWGKALV